MAQYLETNILLTDNSALENILSTERETFECVRLWAVTEFVWIPLVHALLTNLSQQQRWKEGVGVRLKERRTEWKCTAKKRQPGFNWESFGIFPKWNNRETGNAITPTEKCVKQVASSLATQSRSSVMNSSCSQRHWGWLVSQKVWSEASVLWVFERDNSAPWAQWGRDK